MTSASRPAIGARSTNALPVAAPPPVPQRLIPLRQTRLRSTKPHVGNAGRAARILHATRRHGAVREQSFCTFLFDARGFDGGARFRNISLEGRPVGAGSKARLQPAEDLARPERGRRSTAACRR